MGKGGQSICLGIFVLLLSLVILRATGSYLGWAALFAPGSIYVLRGFYLIATQY